MSLTEDVSEGANWTVVRAHHALVTAVLNSSIRNLQELVAGARTRAQVCELERSVFDSFVKRGRVFVPMIEAFVRSGQLMGGVAAREGWPAVGGSPSLLNDTLLAASCRELGITMITQDGDFDRFAPFLTDRRPVAPWPVPSS